VVLQNFGIFDPDFTKIKLHKTGAVDHTVEVTTGKTVKLTISCYNNKINDS
jgi:hypothetical protein